MADKYKVTIGLAITKEGGSLNFFDAGAVYHNMPYDKMVVVEGVFARHASELNKALEPMMEELVALGVVEAEMRKVAEEEAAAPETPKGAIR